MTDAERLWALHEELELAKVAIADARIAQARAERERDAERHRKQELGTALVEARRAMQAAVTGLASRRVHVDDVTRTLESGLEKSEC